MKTILFFLFPLFFISSLLASPHDLDFRCTASSPEVCQKRILNTLNRIGCEPLEANCSYEIESDDNGETSNEAIYCSARSNKCSEPTIQLIGTSKCSSHQQKINLRNFNNSFSLTYMTGLFNLWVRVLCLDQ